MKRRKDEVVIIETDLRGLLDSPVEVRLEARTGEWTSEKSRAGRAAEVLAMNYAPNLGPSNPNPRELLDVAERFVEEMGGRILEGPTEPRDDDDPEPLVPVLN